ncbi:MAG: hypothetical protein ACFCVH_10230 [Alphaproteobacteria bacterium]
MSLLNQFDEPEEDGTVFRDVIMLVLFGFVTIVVLLLPHLNPPTKAEETLVPPGNLVVEVRWPDEADVDIDLWVRAPGDRSVGYSNKSGEVFDLLRDDLGNRNDPTGMNYEVAFSRGLPAGEYVVNLHLYRDNQRLRPITAMVVISLRAPNGGETSQLMSQSVELRRLGEELTVTRFTIDEEGRLVPGSFHDLPVSLRARAN